MHPAKVGDRQWRSSTTLWLIMDKHLTCCDKQLLGSLTAAAEMDYEERVMIGHGTTSAGSTSR